MTSEDKIRSKWASGKEDWKDVVMHKSQIAVGLFEGTQPT